MTYTFAAPAHTRLFAEFADALGTGEQSSPVDTPAFRVKRQSITDVLLDEMAGDKGRETLGHFQRLLASALKSSDPALRLEAMAAAAALSRAHADYHAEAGDLDDADADDVLAAELADAKRLQAKDALIGA